MKIKLYDRVLLDDGRIADIVEVLDGVYVADIDLGGEYDTSFVYPEQIKKVIRQ